MVTGVRGVAPRRLHAAQLLLLQISLGRHAAEHGPLAGVVADLSDEDLERAHPVAAHRFHVAPVDGERDRPRFGRGRPWQCRGVALQSGADTHRPLTDRLDFRGVPERELIEQRAGAAVRQQGAHLGEGALILRRAAVGHDLRGRGDGPARRHTAPAGTEAGCTNLHDAKQRRQPPATNVLQRPLRPAALAASPVPAMLLRLRVNQMALQPGQGLLAFRQRQPQRFGRRVDRAAAADADFMGLDGTGRSGQFHEDSPLHPALLVLRDQADP